MDHVVPATAACRNVAVVQNVRIARDTYRLRIADPEMARAIRPGQFLMVRASSGTDPLLGRPFALYDVARDDSGSPISIDVVFLVIGKGTAALAEKKPGDMLTVWGPLGNGFEAPPTGPVVCVAGGIGQTPFLALAKWWCRGETFGDTAIPAGSRTVQFTILYGTRSADLLAGVDDFRGSGAEVEIATDDGSAGHHGFVTDLLRARIVRGDRPGMLIACGPPPMLAAVAGIALTESIPCLLSLENHMACGFGACFSCVAPIRGDDGATDLRRVCVEGPIFPAESVVFGSFRGQALA